MPKDAVESGHQIHLSQDQARAYVDKRVEQWLTDKRSLRSVELAEELYKQTHLTRRVASSSQVEVKLKNPHQ